MAHLSGVLVLFIFQLFCLPGISMRTRNDEVTISFYQTNYTVSESGTAAGYGVSVCLNITGKGHGPSRNSIDLQFTTSSGTASEGSDFTLSGNQTIWRTDSGDEWSSEYCLQVIQLCDDEIPENSEIATIIIRTTTSHVILIQESFTLVISDNDFISVAFTRNTYTVAEGGEVEVCVEASGSLERPYLQLSLQTSIRTASNNDFSVSGSELQFTAEGGGVFQKCMTLTAVDDDLPEQMEYFRLSVSTTEPLVDIQRPTVRIYITDNDPVVFSIPETVHEVTEGESAEVCLMLANHNLPRILFYLSVTYYSGNATGLDYTLQNPRDFSVGANSHSICFDVLTIDDILAEGTEAVVFHMHLTTHVSWVVLEMPDEPITEIIIQDNDVVRVWFGLSSYSAVEGSLPYVSFCIRVNGVIGPHTNLKLNITTTSLTAVGGRDFEVDDREVYLSVSDICRQLCIIDDTEPEYREEFFICIHSHSPLVEITTECIKVYIIDDDIPEVHWNAYQYVVTESEMTVEVCAELTGTLNTIIEVDLVTEDFSAVGYYDYLPEDHALSFGPSLNKSQCKNIQILQDEFTEDFEYVRVSLRNRQGVVLNIPQPHILVIIQDSTRPTVQCTEDSVELNEGSDNSSYSLVEMCSGGKWMSVCDHTQWTKEDATTICRQVGHATKVAEQRSLPSLQTAGGSFRCTPTETSLAECLVVEPRNHTCQHLEIICVNSEVVTASMPPVTTTEVPPVSTNTTNSTPSIVTTSSIITTSIHISSSDSSSFPIVGVIVGITSALLLVSVALVISLLVGGLLWMKKHKCPAVETNSELSHYLDNPVYHVLDSSTSPISSSSTSGISHRTDSEHYTEIPPLASPSTPESFYDVIREPVPEVEGADEEGKGIVQKIIPCGEANERDCLKTEHDGIAQEKIPPYAQTNVYEVVSDPTSSLDKEGGYSSLDRRWEYATLEPYIGAGSSRRKDIVQYHGGKKNDEYAHLHH